MKMSRCEEGWSECTIGWIHHHWIRDQEFAALTFEIRKDVTDFLPPVYALSQEVAAFLLNRGTLDFTQLFRLSSLPAKHIKAALGILSIHSLLYHSETETRNGSKEMYEMNEQRILERMRIGLYAELVGQWMKKAVQGSSGYAMETVVQALACEGMLKQEELVSILSFRMKSEPEVDFRHLLGGGGDDSGRYKGKGKASDAIMGDSRMFGHRNLVRNEPHWL